MSAHPIENIMQTTMENIRNMVDVNTIVGDTVVMGDGTVIIPISKVAFGFVAGGGEYSPGGDVRADQDSKKGDNTGTPDYPFAGGAGAGVSISPMAFLVVGTGGEVDLLPVQFNSSSERLLSKVPEIFCQLKDLFGKKSAGKPDGQGKDGGQTKESWFSRNKRSKFDENEAVDENYRASKDEL